MASYPPSGPYSDETSERRRRKRALAKAFRIFGRLGFDEGAAGHITARDPGDPDKFWVNPYGVSFKRMRVADLILVNSSGAVVEGEGRVNPAAFAIHSQVHAARPDVVAAAHAHSVYGKAFSALHRRLRPLTQDSCIFFEDHGLYELYGGIASETEEGKRIAAAVGESKAAILVNHGLITVGGSVEQAVFWFVSMERSCQAELAVLAGDPNPIPCEMAREAHARIGTRAAGERSAAPLFEWISAEQPDCLEEEESLIGEVVL